MSISTSHLSLKRPRDDTEAFEPATKKDRKVYRVHNLCNLILFNIFKRFELRDLLAYRSVCKETFSNEKIWNAWISTHPSWPKIKRLEGESSYCAFLLNQLMVRGGYRTPIKLLDNGDKKILPDFAVEGNRLIINIDYYGRQEVIVIDLNSEKCILKKIDWFLQKIS